MTRTLKALSALVLGGMFLFSTACEDKECKESLTKATAAAADAAKAQSALTLELNAMKSKLAASEGALAMAKKELEAAKAPKADEPAPAPAAKPAKKGKKK